MPADIKLYEDSRLTRIIDDGADISRVELDENKPGSGEPRRLYVVNAGDTTLRALTVDIEGEGADTVQLAIDEAGEPGIWAAAGESILLASRTVPVGKVYSFWARAVFSFDDREGKYPFKFAIKAVSIG